MTNYNIIGGDGRQYGPISAVELRQWITEGRLNGQSLAQVVGNSGWQALASFPEFGEFLRAHTAPPPIATRLAPADWSARILDREPELRIGECLGAGFGFLAANAGFVLGAVLLSWLMRLLVSFVPVAPLLLNGVITGGLYLACLRSMRGEKVGVGDLFDGFKHHFVQLMLAGAISSLLTQLGLLLCLLPGLYLFVAWVFALPLIADKRMEFWSAMELSRKVVTRVWPPMFLILTLVFLPFLLVQIFAGFQMGEFIFRSLRDVDFDVFDWLQSLPQYMEPLIKLSAKAALIGQIGYLISQFIAVGALMRAYENLFGERRA